MGSCAVGFLCDTCGQKFSIQNPLNLCPECNGLLEVQYDLTAMKKSAACIGACRRDKSIWKYKDFFPPVSQENIISLGEGQTPLVKSVYLSKKLGLENIYFKNDTLMPTGSFKDRGFSLAVSNAKQLGVKTGFTYSSGNAGMSFGAYASRASLDALVLVEYNANSLKKAVIALYGSKTVILDYDNFQQISTMLEKAGKELGLYQFVNFINPVRHEAMKTYAYEIYESLDRVPDAVFQPVGTGGGIWGAWKGFCELADIGIVDLLPRMYGVQPETSAHFKEAFEKGKKTAGQFGDCTRTIAQSIASDSPIKDGRRILKAIYDSKGAALGVSDDEILEAMRDLAKEGILAEPSSAASVAAMKQAFRKGSIQSDDTIVCVITGSAMKQPDMLEKVADFSGIHIHANIAELEKLIENGLC